MTNKHVWFAEVLLANCWAACLLKSFLPKLELVLVMPALLPLTLRQKMWSFQGKPDSNAREAARGERKCRIAN